MEVKKTILSNGLRLITVNVPGLESVGCVVLTGVGSRYETKDKLGISHVLEHMAFKGTTKRPKAKDIATLVEGVGGEWNAFTDKEETAYWIKLGGENLGLALDVLSDILINPILDPQELTKEKGVVLEEIKMRRDTPRIHIDDIFAEQVLGDQPIGWDTAGDKKSLDKIERSDVKTFIDSYYKSDNMVVALAGKIPGDVTETVERFFSGLARGKTPGYLAAVMEQSAPSVQIDRRPTEQAHIALGVEGVARSDQDYYPLQLLVNVLGEGMSSRLWESIREEKGLAYTVRAGSDSYHDTGLVMVYVGVATDKAEAAVQAILEEMKKIIESKVTSAELNKAKANLKGRLKLSLEETDHLAVTFGLRELLENRVLTVDDIITLIDRVTDKDILRVATRIFRTEKLNLSLIGPYEEKDRFLKLLKL